MHASLILSLLSGLAVANAQVPPPASLLTHTMSAVLPILPTGFSGVETEEGAIIYDGPPVPGFTGPGGNATVQNGNPAAIYRAVLPSTNFDNLTGSIITGTITGTANANGTGVTFTVDFSGFPSEAEYGPFVYHVHALPVPANGNCTATLGHLDPTDRGELHACEMAAPQTCQAGDLAGKHGNITGTSFTASYQELYLSTTPGSPYYFGDKSIVIHSTNTTRLTCANFTLVGSNSTTTSPNVTTPSSPSSTTGLGVATGAAYKTAASGFVAGLAGVIAFFL